MYKINRETKEEKLLLEIKTNESEAAAKIIVVGVGWRRVNESAMEPAVESIE